MKNKFLLISILIISFSAIFLFSCKKVINKPDETGTYSGLRTYSGLADAMSDITFADSVLVFADTDNFVATYQFLDSLYEDYNDKFEYAHRTLTDSALDYLADSLRFDEQAPFAWFESSFTGFHSLRKHVKGEIEKWLAHDSLDFRNDPDDIEIQGNVLRTLVNENGYVKIGTAMYNMNNGRVEDTTGCHGWKRLHKEYNYGAGMHKFKNIVVLRDYAFFSVVYGSVVNYKKKNSTGWKLEKTKLYVQVGGNGRDKYCAAVYTVGNFKGPKHRSELETSETDWGQTIRAQDNDIATYSEVTSAPYTGVLYLVF